MTVSGAAQADRWQLQMSVCQLNAPLQISKRKGRAIRCGPALLVPSPRRCAISLARTPIRYPRSAFSKSGRRFCVRMRAKS
jgi:hypothetical protein